MDGHGRRKPTRWMARKGRRKEDTMESVDSVRGKLEALRCECVCGCAKLSPYHAICEPCNQGRHKRP